MPPANLSVVLSFGLRVFSEMQLEIEQLEKIIPIVELIF